MKNFAAGQIKPGEHRSIETEIKTGEHRSIDTKFKSSQLTEAIEARVSILYVINLKTNSVNDEVFGAKWASLPTVRLAHIIHHNYPATIQ